MKKTRFTESAEEFFKELKSLLIGRQDLGVRGKTQMLRDIMRRCVNQAVEESELNFSGLFAKVDYLVKENGIPEKEARQIHDTRNVLSSIRKYSDDELEESLKYDIKAVALLVSYTCGNRHLPGDMLMMLPTRERKLSWGKFSEVWLRCIVEDWNEECINVTEAQNGGKLKVCYSAENKYLTRDGKGDWSYLRQILKKGAQLNLVRLRYNDDGVCMPELIIYEPDYLINITTIASCFETYAESPFVSLVNKLKPQANSLAIHLGNLAGQFLDDTVNGRDVPFNESVTEFFRQHAISMVSCPEMGDEQKIRDFYRQAKIQKKNIQKLIGEDLAKAVGKYNPKSVVLEPSFFSQILGIQGRMDFLAEDENCAIIIEQKSGKGAFQATTSPDYNPDAPLPQEKHLVQLLLYRALYTYAGYGSVNHIMLLYSKYKSGLVSTAQYPELLLRAIRMRNLLAWCEMDYAENGMRVLATLTPDKLNMKHCTGKLWQQYTLPELTTLFMPIQTATPLERSYYLRFMHFVAKEQMLAKLGNKTKENSGFAAKWLDTLEDKKASGNIYDCLTVVSIEMGREGKESKEGRESREDSMRIVLEFSEEQCTDSSNFRRGDIVILYPYKEGEEPDVCRQMVLRGSIEDITSNGISVVLRNEQTNVDIFHVPGNMFWTIEHDLFDSSASTQFSALHSFLSAPKERRDLILCQRKPTIDTSIKIRGEYGAFNTLVTSSIQNRDIFLVIGPPGTGKTSFAMLNILKEEGAALLLSFTNRAVDEMCSKLDEEGLDYIRIGNELACERRYHDHLLSNRISRISKASEVAEIITSTPIFCATTASMNANLGIFNIKHFSLAIIDEASQILEPQLIGLMSVTNGTRPAIDRFVMIGDHKQLPAVVQQTEEESRVEEPELRAIHLTDCRNSMFERLLKSFTVTDDTGTHYDARYVYMLTKQGRMHRDIAEFVNHEFYGSHLDVVPLKHQIEPTAPVIGYGRYVELMTTHRISFVSSKAPIHSISMKTNEVEAQMIAEAVLELAEYLGDNFNPATSIGIIVPYRNQIATIRSAIEKLLSSRKYPLPPGGEMVGVRGCTIDTVERFQGSQRDYIIYGFTIQRPYQLNFLTNNVFEENGQIIDRKLNVAMTRAKKALLLIGNPGLLRQNYTFRRLLEFVEQS